MAQSLGPAVAVQAMVADGVEVSVGFVRDEAFGPLVVVAAGGTLVELLADRAVACPPVSHAGALRLLRRACGSGRCWPGGAVDPPSTSTRSPTSWCGSRTMAVELGEVFDAVEANPVIASADGVVAVDGLVIVRGGIRE